MFFQTKRTKALVVSLCTGLFLLTTNTSAEIINGNAFLYGDNIIAGINATGSFGSKVNVPDGEVFEQSLIGFASDPTRQGFAGNYDGDFFLPGFAEEGWAVTVHGNHYNNNRNLQTTGVPGELSNFIRTSRFSSVDWRGSIGGLDIVKTYKTFSDGLALIMDIELTNTSRLTLTDVYYMRTVDPDNNAENLIAPTHDYATRNTIVQQGGTGTATVEASQPNGASGSSVLTLSAYTKRGRVSHGGHEVRNPIEVYNGTGEQLSSGSATEDMAISTAVKFDKILPGEKVKFTLSYSLAGLVPPVLLLDSDNSSQVGNGNFKLDYLLGGEPVPLADNDVSASTSTGSFDGLKVIITNPHLGDKISISPIPAGMQYDADAHNDATEINLHGNGDADTYIEAIKALRFENKLLGADLVTREVVIQLLDEDLFLSNTRETDVYITVPLVINTPITSDNIVTSDDIDEGLPISGITAPNADMTLTLTDDIGISITSTTRADENGAWISTIQTTQLSTLAEGTVTIDAKSTDQNNNVTTATTTFIKDTVVKNIIIRPPDHAIVNEQNLLIEGETDPNATILVTTTDNINCSARADSVGHWSCTLNGLEKGETYPITVNAADDLNVHKIEQLTVTVSNLSLAITSPQRGQNAEDETPLIIGITEPNVDITVTTEFGDECKTVSDDNGDWSCHLDTMPVGGPHDITIAAADTALGSEITQLWQVVIPDRPLIVTEPVSGDVNTQLPMVFRGIANPNAEVKVTAPSGEVCTTISDTDGKWHCAIADVQPGDDQQFTISTTLMDGSRSEVTRNLNITVLDGSVETIITGGGFFGPTSLFFFLLLLFYHCHKKVVFNQTLRSNK